MISSKKQKKKKKTKRKKRGRENYELLWIRVGMRIMSHH